MWREGRGVQRNPFFIRAQQEQIHTRIAHKHTGHYRVELKDEHSVPLRQLTCNLAELIVTKLLFVILCVPFVVIQKG